MDTIADLARLFLVCIAMASSLIIIGLGVGYFQAPDDTADPITQQRLHDFYSRRR